MYDAPGAEFVNCKEPAWIMGRWLGAGAATPTVVAKTTKLTGNPGAVPAISRSGVGTLSVVIAAPVGIVQSYDFWVNSGSSATDKNVRVTPPSGGTFALQVTFHANGTAVDLAATDELCMMVVTSLAPNP